MTSPELPVWDVHHHWVNEEGYIDRLLREMDRLGVERLGLIAMGDLVPDLFVLHGPVTGSVDNEDLADLVRRHPDRFWGWGFIRLGHCQPDIVDRLRDLGMAGLKFHVPDRPYSEGEYFPIYEKASAYGMPCLFHTGIFYPPSPMPGQGIRSENYRPIHLEPIAHEFPDLRMICAHLGVCWNDEAAAICRMCPHIYADLSGRVDGWRSSKPVDWWRQTLYWPDAHRKILFGSDVHSDEIGASLEDHRRILADLGWTSDQVRNVLSANARQLFA
jgi:hypothetical protein